MEEENTQIFQQLVAHSLLREALCLPVYIIPMSQLIITMVIPQFIYCALLYPHTNTLGSTEYKNNDGIFK